MADSSSDRGRDAEQPTQLPAKGLKDVLVRTKAAIKEDNVSLLAAGVAFYALLALVPGLVALVSIYGLAADPADVTRQVRDALAAAPDEARELVESQLSAITEGDSSSVSIGAIAGILLALWSASAGMGHLITAINIAYGERETRGWLRRKALSLAMTIGAILFFVVAIGLVTLLPSLLAETGLGNAARLVLNIARWPLLALSLLVGLAILYRYAPNRDEPKWTWASPGAIVATVLWLLASIVFSIYTANFASYNETYGSLGAVVILMMWLFISAFVVVLGAEFNAELEHQTAVDTTAGEPEPMGVRGAVVADTIGEPAERVRNRG